MVSTKKELDRLNELLNEGKWVFSMGKDFPDSKALHGLKYWRTRKGKCPSTSTDDGYLPEHRILPFTYPK